LPQESVEQVDFCGAASPRAPAIGAKLWRSPQVSRATKPALPSLEVPLFSFAPPPA
jgi:hypothetical protein